ncbi:MAG: iron-sulfur cluster repair di-iron protein [Cytophagales bacterium]|nr:iron-sulfur cluster repair di-iron protein [Bernardetiaceae bacterium]MDW8211690.1 iron-sulfur cluster repair di-iron protein [Cytophagales bacterium]
MLPRNKRLFELVAENHALGAILHVFGIDFCQHGHQTLEAICRQKRISTIPILKEWESMRQQERVFAPDLLKNYAVDAIIDYLKNAHRIFMRRRLPYMQHLVENARADSLSPKMQEILNDLKVAFPLFAEDFIRHILEEENSTFKYILLLDDALYHRGGLGKAFFAMQKHTMQSIAIKHHHDDDEMQGIRELTHHYATDSHTPLVVRVLYSELQRFEKELQIHAAIENRILLPKALVLEDKVKRLLQEKAALN